MLVFKLNKIKKIREMSKLRMRKLLYRVIHVFLTRSEKALKCFYRKNVKKYEYCTFPNYPVQCIILFYIYFFFFLELHSQNCYQLDKGFRYCFKNMHHFFFFFFSNV